MSSFVDNSDPDKEEADHDKEEADHVSIHLLSLSNNGIGSIVVVLKFLTIYDVSKLDVAYCNHEKRHELLEILSDNPLIIYDIKFHGSFEQFDCVLKWIGLRNINISELNMGSHCYRNSYLTDAGLIGLAMHCGSLRSLNIGACNSMLEYEGVCRITDTGIIELARHCTSLQSLDISYRSLSDTGLIELAKHCTSLQSLDIGSCKRITDAGLIGIARHCTSLQSLGIGFCKITDAGLIEIARHCTSLQSLHMVQCMMITDAGLIEIVKHCTDLKSLNARFCKITDASLIEISKHCTSLKRLMFGECKKITNTGRAVIRRSLPSLEQLDDEISNTHPDRVYPYYYNDYDD